MKLTQAVTIQVLTNALDYYSGKITGYPTLDNLSLNQIKYLLFKSRIIETQEGTEDFYILIEGLIHTNNNRQIIDKNSIAIMSSIIEVTSQVALLLRDKILSSKELKDSLSAHLYHQYSDRDFIETKGLDEFTTYYLNEYDGYLFGPSLINILGLQGISAGRDLYSEPDLMDIYATATAYLLSEEELDSAENIYCYFIVKTILGKFDNQMKGVPDNE